MGNTSYPIAKEVLSVHVWPCPVCIVDDLRKKSNDFERSAIKQNKKRGCSHSFLTTNLRQLISSFAVCSWYEIFFIT